MSLSLPTIEAPAVGELDGLRQSDWIASSGIARTSCFALFKLAGIEPELRRPPGGGKPVAFLTQEHLAALEPLAERFRQGASLSQIEAELHSTALNRSEPAEIGRNDAEPPAWLELVITAVRSLEKPADPLSMARQLKEAAELGVPLSQSEVANLLGLSISSIESWRGDQQVRPGYRLRRESDGRRVWWHVIRERAEQHRTVLNEAPARVTGIGFHLEEAQVAAGQAQEVTFMVRGPILPVIC